MVELAPIVAETRHVVGDIQRPQSVDQSTQAMGQAFKRRRVVFNELGKHDVKTHGGGKTVHKCFDGYGQEIVDQQLDIVDVPAGQQFSHQRRGVAQGVVEAYQHGLAPP